MSVVVPSVAVIVNPAKSASQVTVKTSAPPPEASVHLNILAIFNPPYDVDTAAILQETLLALALASNVNVTVPLTLVSISV